MRSRDRFKNLKKGMWTSDLPISMIVFSVQAFPSFVSRMAKFNRLQWGRNNCLFFQARVGCAISQWTHHQPSIGNTELVHSSCMTLLKLWGYQGQLWSLLGPILPGSECMASSSKDSGCPERVAPSNVEPWWPSGPCQKKLWQRVF